MFRLDVRVSYLGDAGRNEHQQGLGAEASQQKEPCEKPVPEGGDIVHLAQTEFDGEGMKQKQNGEMESRWELTWGGGLPASV